MKILRCPKCDQAHNVADNVLAAYCNVGHATAAYDQGLPAEDEKVYPIGWPAWFKKACEIVESTIGQVPIIVRRFRELYADQLSPADAVYRLYGVHL